MFQYLGEAFKSFALFAGLQISQEISIEEAIAYLDDAVTNFELDERSITKARQEIMYCSFQGNIAIDDVEEIVQTLTHTIKMPIFLRHFPRIYHVLANYQFNFEGPGTSCGFWAVANAKAIDLYLRTHSSLNLREINLLSQKIINNLFSSYQIHMLEAENINFLLVKDDHCKLNELFLSGLANLCTIKSKEQYDEARWVGVADNKVHIVKTFSNAVSPCCFENNMEVGKTKSDVIKELVDSLCTGNPIGELIGRIAEIAESYEQRDKEDIMLQVANMHEIDSEYLLDLMQCFDKDIQDRVLSKIIAYQDNRIVETDLNNIKDCAFKLLDKKYPELQLSAFKKNKKLLTLANVSWIIAEEASATIEELAESGRLSALVYFKALFTAFREKVDAHQASAFHFVCHLGTHKYDQHWILISVIMLPQKGPFLTMMDSMNEKIELDLKLDDSVDFNQIYNAIGSSEAELKTKQKLLYLLFFYDLFINGNCAEIDNNIKKAVRLLDSHESGDERQITGDGDDEDAACFETLVTELRTEECNNREREDEGEKYI